MAKAETDIVHAILLACCDGETAAIWKNVRGGFYPIADVKPLLDAVMSCDIARARMVAKKMKPLSAGLSAPGSSDLIGLKRVTITPEMVGKTVAVFTAIEVKAGSSVRPDQVAFLGKVLRYGGIAGVAYCVDDAVKLLAGPAIE